jgi:hypothetical protein
MTRVLLSAATLAVVSFACRAGEIVVRLNVRPVPAPKPALKYRLFPELREMNPGNPAQWYLRCFAEQRNFFFSKEGTAQRTRYLTMPLDELRAEKVRKYGGYALTQADWGARLDALDWQVLERVKAEGFDLSLPEVGPLRILGTALRARFRIEVAEGRFEDATGTAKTMFALARHLGEYPAEPANRIGLLIAGMALDTLEEMLPQSDSPNLYWALTDLPRPLVDVRKGVQGGRIVVETDLRPLRNDTSMTEQEIEKVVSRLSGVMGYAREQAGAPPRSLRAQLAARAKDAERVRAARARLVEAGCAADRLKNFSNVQIILLDEKRAYEVRRDEEMKLLGLALWEIDAQPEVGDDLFADLLPHPLKIRRVQGRLEQRVALLRHVEALRTYAAAHDGKLPAKLTDCSVPLSDDPFTGKPFRYQVDGNTAHLHGGPLPTEKKNSGSSVHYEVTLRK